MNQNLYRLHDSDQRFTDLRPLFSGREQCTPLHCWGPGVRPNYIIHYILDGEGIYRVGDETLRLHAGEGFLIEPEVQTFYQADARHPWTYCWVGFDGTLAPELVRELGLGGNRLTFYCGDKEALEEVFSTLLKYQSFSAVNDLILQSALFRFFAILMRDLTVRAKEPSSLKNDYVHGAVQFIRNNYYRSITVEDIAAYTGINRSYLYTLFIKETGMSPSNYLRNFRLSRAAELLSITNYSVESIAYSCGYQDPLVFSKAFKKEYHQTPLRYRQNNTFYI